MSITQVRDVRILQEKPDDAVYQVRKGANSAVYTKRQFLNPSSSQMSIVLPVCAKGVGRTRTGLYLHCKGQVVLSGTNLSVDNISSGCIGWKPWPLNRNFTVAHIIGNAQETLDTAQIIDVLSNLNMTPEKGNFYENSQQDLYADYNELVGENINPLAPYASNVNGSSYKSRCFGITDIEASTPAEGTGANTLTVTFDLEEPLMTPFTFLSTEDEPALFNIPSEQINITSAKAMNDMLAFVTNQIDNTATITSQVTTVSEAELYVCYVSMNPDEVSESSSLVFPSFTFQPSNSYGSIDNPTQAGVPEPKPVNSTINYQNIPDKVIYCARQAWNARTVLGPTTDVFANGRSSFPDRFLVLDQPQVSLNNLPSALNGASKRQLFDISKRNGYSGNYEHFAGLPLDYGNYNIIGAGSVLVLDPVLDLGLSQSGLSNDVNANYTLNASFLAQNYLVDPNVLAPPSIGDKFCPIINSLELACIVMTKKELVRNGLDYISRPLSISVEQAHDVLSMKESDSVPTTHVENQDDTRMQGAGFASFLSKAKNAATWAMKNKDKIVDGAKIAKGLYDTHIKGGYEMGGYMMGGASSGKKKTIKLHKYK